MVNAVLYQARTGCQWRYLPAEFGPWGAVWQQFRRWRAKGVWAAAMDRLRRAVRVSAGRDPEPSMVMLDSQTAKGGRNGPTFHEAGGKLSATFGAKRTLLVDYLGLPVAARSGQRPSARFPGRTPPLRRRTPGPSGGHRRPLTKASSPSSGPSAAATMSASSSRPGSPSPVDSNRSSPFGKSRTASPNSAAGAASPAVSRRQRVRPPPGSTSRASAISSPRSEFPANPSSTSGSGWGT